MNVFALHNIIMTSFEIQIPPDLSSVPLRSNGSDKASPTFFIQNPCFKTIPPVDLKQIYDYSVKMIDVSNE